MADGKPFLLGMENLATSLSTLVRRGAGPALRVRVESGPPLAVNSQEKVTNLNADLLDGRDSSYYKPFGVAVNADGSPSSWYFGGDVGENPALEAVEHPRTGVYVVRFTRNVSKRPRIATLGRADGAYFDVDAPEYDPDDFGPNSPYIGHVFTDNVWRNGAQQEDQLAVFTFNFSGEMADRSFQLIVFPEGS